MQVILIGTMHNNIIAPRLIIGPYEDDHEAVKAMLELDNSVVLKGEFTQIKEMIPAVCPCCASFGVATEKHTRMGSCLVAGK